jgi:outer membrane protein assembly factor BamB
MNTTGSVSEAESPASVTIPAATNALQTRPQPRIWPSLTLMVVFWIFLFALDQTDLTMFVRFISRMIAILVFLLGSLGLWFASRRIPRRQKWLEAGIFFGLYALACVPADHTMPPLAMMISTFPLALTAWVLWRALSRTFSPRAQWLGLAGVLFVVFGYFDLVRWDGLDGHQRTKMSWRWTPTAEELFLGATAGASPSKTTEPWGVTAGDWPEFRGQGRLGIAAAVAKQDWSSEPPRLKWKHRVGPAWSSMILVDGHLVTQEQRDENEVAVCYDALTGEELWSHADAVRFDETLSGSGPRGTPTYHEGRIWTYGAEGRLNCLEARTGKLLWSHDVLRESGGGVPQWGLSVSPLVVDGLVIVFAGGKDNQGVIAYRCETGELAWSQPASTISFSSPQPATLSGTEQVLMQDSASLKSFDPQTGKLHWEYALGTPAFQPMLQPHPVNETRVLATDDSGLVLLEVVMKNEKWAVSPVWSSTRLKAGFNDFVVHKDAIFGLDDGILCCLDLETGKRTWKSGRYGHGQLLLLSGPGQLLVIGEQGDVHLVAADPDSFHALGTFQALTGKTWNHPAIADGKLFVRNAEEMCCFELHPATGEVATVSSR